VSPYLGGLGDKTNRVFSFQIDFQVKMGGKLGKSNTYIVTCAEDLADEPASYANPGRRKSVFAEAYNPEEDEGTEEAKVVHPKTDEQRHRLAEAVKSCLLFRALDNEQLREVLDAMFERRAEPGETIITQDADGDNYYVVEDGVYAVLVKQENGVPKQVMTYDNKGSFGELALLYNMPRAATVQAKTSGSLWAMDRQTFRKIVLRNAYQKRKMYESFLLQVPLLHTLDDYERMNIADALMTQTYANGDTVIKQGDPASGMYFVEAGKVTVIKRGENGEEKKVNEINQGGYFGELGLMNHAPRAASIVADGAVRVAFLDVSAFERLLGPCMEILKNRTTEYEEQLAKAFGSKVKV